MMKFMTLKLSNGNTLKFIPKSVSRLEETTYFDGKKGTILTFNDGGAYFVDGDTLELSTKLIDFENES